MKIGNKDGNIGLGLPSIVLIVMVAAMAVFAVLALRSANAEKKLADRTKDAVTGYYAAETAAEEKIAEIDSVISENADTESTLQKIKEIQGVTGAEAKTAAGGTGIYSVTMYIEAGDTEGMGIKAGVDFSSEGGYDITEWKLVREEIEGGYELVLPD